jgi:maleate isomerase
MATVTEHLVPHLEAAYDAGPGERASLGLIALATDRACAGDVARFLPEDPGIEVFVHRIPMSVIATPETLRAQQAHLTEAAANLVPGSRLDAIGFGCTSAGAAIGVDRAENLIRDGRPGIPVTTAIGAAGRGLQAVGATRIALLTPYLDSAHALVEDYLASAGFDVMARASFHLEGDPDMNRISPASLIEAGRALGSASDVDALFISCTGVRTRHVIAPLEHLLSKPVLSSNQALAWEMLRLSGYDAPVAGRGMLLLV